MATSPPLPSSPARAIELATGVRLEYVEQGDPEGAPMVLLHGLSDSWRSYEPVLPHLPESIHAFALSMRGHGDSSRPLDRYAGHDLADDVAAFMDAVGLESAIVVGHSMGSIVAARAALAHPERLDGLVLMAGATAYAKLDIAELGAYIDAMSDPVDPEFVREFQASTLTDAALPGILDVAVAQSLKLPARVWKAVFAGTIRDDYSGELGRIPMPALLLWGELEQYVPPADQAALAAAIPDARAIVYPMLSHALHWERPDLIAADLAAFAAQLQSVT